MNVMTLDRAVAEAKRFIEIAKADRLHRGQPNYPDMYPSKARTAAVKRASMDLSRALSEMRRAG